jgi:alkanesulfonate monooxygenase SsuD/methylene tetrahydromethanopterin reductase-like flavin-dependent oxidoreductase (luciferase family)
MAALVDDEMLRTFAVIGEPADVARQILDRFDGQVERVSPVIYTPSTDLLSVLLSSIREMQS